MVVTGASLSDAAAPLSGLPTNIPSITVPTAGMTHLTGADSTLTTSAGTKLMINIPADGRSLSCMKGGRRRGSRKSKAAKASKSKKSKKASKSSRR
jgi:hypothetical protein